MQFCILGRALGTREHLIVSDNNFSWTYEKPIGMLCLGEDSNKYSIDYAAKLFRFNVPNFASIPQASFFNKVGISLHEVHWQHALSDDVYQSIIRNVVKGAKHVAMTLEESCYGNMLQRRLKLLEDLDRARINRKRFNDCLRFENDATQLSNLKSFTPDDDGFAKKVMYDGTQTSTGRMNVADGPRILTLRKQHRAIVESTYDEGDIISVDYSSLEPRVALAMSGINPAGDLYEWIDNEVFGGKLGRSKAKILTLSIIYGMSLHTARSEYGDVSMKQKKELKELFSVDKITNDLLKQESLTNYFGRPIFPHSKEKVFNSFIQSTAVDTAVAGFHEVVDKLRAAGGCRSLFLIHDEIICDVPKSVSSDAKKIFNDGISISFQGEDISFPVAVERICG
tara:strand:+ start:1390 stop:2577 length:1188 start_codon:yes stop_codon:yes gene_type:complete